MRVRAESGRELAVAPEAHAIRIAGELQRRQVGAGIGRVRLMAVSAMRLSFAKTRRAPECFDDERGFTKPAVFVERPPGNVGIGTAEISWWKCGALRCVVQFTVRARLPQSRLRVALAANRDIIARTNVAKVGGRVSRAVSRAAPRGHGEHVILSGSVAHLAIDATLAKFVVMGARRTGLGDTQLAGVARRTVGLISGGGIELIEAGDLSAPGTRRIDHLPVVDPFLFNCAVLDRKHVDVSARHKR